MAGGSRLAHDDCFESEIEAMYDCYCEGCSLSEVGEKFFRVGKSVEYLFKTRGYPLRTTHETRSMINRRQFEPMMREMHKHYTDGMSITDIAIALHCNRKTVYARFRRFGLPIYPARRSGTVRVCAPPPKPEGWVHPWRRDNDVMWSKAKADRASFRERVGVNGARR